MRFLLITLVALSTFGCGRLSDNDSNGGDRLVNESGPNSDKSTDTPPDSKSDDHDLQDLVPLASITLTLSPDRVQSSTAVDVTGFKQILFYGSEYFKPFGCRIAGGNMKMFDRLDPAFGLTSDVSTHLKSGINSPIYEGDFNKVNRRPVDGNWMSLVLNDRIDPSVPVGEEPAVFPKSCTGEVTLKVVGVR